MTRAEKIKRYIMLAIGLCIMAFGIAFSIKADLGTSPISSLPYVASLLCPLTVGQTTILLHCILIAFQIMLLRKQYELVQLMQLPVAFVFGYLNDFALWAIRDLSCHNYLQQWIFCVIGLILVAIGVSFEVTAGVVTLAGEGAILAICKVTDIPFPRMKIIFDVTLVGIAVVLSVLCLKALHGVREGTIAAAIFVGIISKGFNKILEKAGF